MLNLVNVPHIYTGQLQCRYSVIENALNAVPHIGIEMARFIFQKKHF